jgi:hypothetical protein
MDNGMADDVEPVPDPAVVERIRRDLGELGSDADSAPEVPPHVRARVVAALRDESSRPAHSVRRPLRRLQVVGLVVGLGAVLAGVVVGASMLSRDPAPRFPVGPTAEQITVDRPAADIPLPDAQIIALLSEMPDYGPLTDAKRRNSCVDGLGYAPGTQVLGARPLNMHGRPAVLLLFPGETSETVAAVAVEPNCSRAHTGLLAKAVVSRT